MFHRKKRIGNQEYWYLCRSYRDYRGKVRQKVVRYLGKEKPAPLPKVYSGKEIMGMIEIGYSLEEILIIMGFGEFLEKEGFLKFNNP